ncbi:MAG: C-GCAxxG-C-C family protein [Bacteroidales bacterium]|nr:C-GCAxxG-C-C family protein [Bacteroidales bacterium]
MAIEKSRKELAVEKKASGKYNCAQAVACTYADKMGLDEEMVKNIAGAFGCGMGNSEGTCGSLVGAGMVLGMVNKDRVKSMKDMRDLMEKFQERNGATRCRLLKGLDTKVLLRACNDCVADSCEFLEEKL